MQFRTVATLVALGSMLSGCATIIKGTTQSISVDSQPVKGAQCTLSSSEGTWYVTTPGSVTVHKTKNDITAVCKKDGFQDATQMIPSHFNGATAGNIIAGGIIGIGIDAASGANYSYPELTVVTMTPVGAPPPPPAQQPAPPPAPAAAPSAKPAS